MEDAEKETAEETGGAGHPPAHFTGAAAATTESDACQRCEYGKEATAVSVGGQDRAGPAPEEDGHGGTGHGGNTQREEGGDETPRRARAERATADGKTEERVPPEQLRAPNASGRRGQEGRADHYLH